jgi:hypothetical protein
MTMLARQQIHKAFEGASMACQLRGQPDAARLPFGRRMATWDLERGAAKLLSAYEGGYKGIQFKTPADIKGTEG